MTRIDAHERIDALKADLRYEVSLHPNGSALSRIIGGEIRKLMASMPAPTSGTYTTPKR